MEAWDALPKLDSYAWRWIAYHLVQAGRKDDLRRLLLNFDWLQGKLETTDLNALIADYDWFDDDKALQQIQGAIRLSAHVIARDKTQLRSQLYGRLNWLGIPALSKQLTSPSAGCWLRLLTPTLATPFDPLKRIFDFDEKEGPLRRLAVATSGVIVSGGDYGVRIWDLSTGKDLQIFSSKNGHYRAHDGGRGRRAGEGNLLVSGGDNAICIWDLENGRLKREIKCENGVDTLAITPDGAIVLVANGIYDRFPHLRSYDLLTCRKLQTFNGHQMGVSSLAITPDGTRLISGSLDKTARVWHIATGECQAVFEQPTSVTDVAVTPDGKYVLSAAYYGVRVWNLSQRGSVTTPKAHTDQVRAIAFSPDGHWVLSGGADRVVRLWDVNTRQPVRVFEGHRRDVFAITVTPDSRRAITAGLDDVIRVWDISSGEQQWAMEGHSYCVRGLAITPDGNRVVSGAEDSVLMVWDLDKGTRLSRFPSDAGEVQAVALTANGTRIVFCDQGGFVHVMELATGKRLLKMGSYGERAWALAITRDDATVIWGTLDRKVYLWDLNNGRQVGEWDSDDRVRSVTLRGDTQLITGEDGGTVHLRDLRSGQRICSFRNDSSGAMVAALSPDGRTIIAGDYAGQVHFLELVEADKTKPAIGDTKISLPSNSG